jgi:hypothetical protein
MTNCEYCIDLGSQIARRWGLDDAELQALPTYATSDLLRLSTSWSSTTPPP